MNQKGIIGGQKGFTLLEILVVLTIMGFLIAMVAPRLAGISGDAVDTVCDTNQNRMVTYMSSYYEKTNRFPNKLTNLVDQVTDATYQLVAVSNDDPEDGAESLASEFMQRNHFRIHYLNAAEAAELKNMGIVKVFNLNAYTGQTDSDALKADYGTSGDDNPNEIGIAVVLSDDKATSMEEVTVEEGLAVAMIGCGINAAAGTTFDVETTELGWGEPDWFGRIVLGMGAESGLVKDGVISNAAHCPGGIQNADNATYNDYNLVLPRLEATADLMTATALGTGVVDADTTTDGIQLTAYAYDEDNAPTTGYVVADNDNNLAVRTVNITEAQERWQFATQCPEGHNYPEDDGAYWGVNLDNGAALTE